MATNVLKNVSLRDCRKILTKVGCQTKRTTGGHEHWTGADLLCQITIQTHINPVPERIILHIKSCRIVKQALQKAHVGYWATISKCFHFSMSSFRSRGSKVLTSKLGTMLIL